MFQDIDFENISYEEGLALVAAQRPLEKQAVSLDDIKQGVGDVLSNPYTQYGLVGAGVGGLGGLASSLLKKKRRRNYLRDAATGAALGGLGGLAVRGGQDALSGLADYSSSTDTLVENEIKKKNTDPGLWQSLKNNSVASYHRMMADAGFPQEITPGGPLAESSAEFAKRTGSNFANPWVATGGAGVTSLAIQGMLKRLGQTSALRNELIKHFTAGGATDHWAKYLVDTARKEGFVPRGLGTKYGWGRLKELYNNIFRGGALPGNPARPFVAKGFGEEMTKRLLPSGKVRVPGNSIGWRQLIRDTTKAMRGPASKTLTQGAGTFFRGGAKAARTAGLTLLPMVAAHMLQTGGTGYAGDLSEAQLKEILNNTE